ncbi:MAG: divergent polysaccharide deacetylase family protein, partial [Algicola sp.]|nr:divergent polysaccharide deacetylase family protein [Algicola sp.]
DNDLSEAAMEQKFDLLVRIAQKYRRAIGIAHPYPETIKFLNKVLPKLTARGVKLVPISELLPKRPLQIATAATATTRND